MDQSSQGQLCQPLGVDGGGSEQCQDFHAFEAASGSFGHTMQGFGQAMCSFDQPTVAGIEIGFVVTPCQSFAARAQDGDMGIGDMDLP